MLARCNMYDPQDKGQHASIKWEKKMITIGITVVVLTAIFLFNRSEFPLELSAELQCRYTGAQQKPAIYNSSRACPNYFKRIKQDFLPWSSIERHHVELAGQRGSMRVVILGGNPYFQVYRKCPQSRSIYTLWGLLMLLDRFPGQVPDIEFVINCKDRPVMSSKSPAPVLSYCTTRDASDIPIPDYSFWGWPEVHIFPWEEQSKRIYAGSEKVQWRNRKKSAFWKGNSRMGRLRKDLLKCNDTTHAQLYEQDWKSESQRNFSSSDLSQQCRHRYNIYLEGAAWSASLKYRMACGSTMLNIDSQYEEFFSKALLPNVHYLRVTAENMCESIRQSVEWGNSHVKEAEAIGGNAQTFLKRELDMQHVYDYLFHVLSEYAKLQRFIPKVPRGAKLLCKGAIEALLPEAIEQKFLKPLGEQEMNMQPCKLYFN